MLYFTSKIFRSSFNKIGSWGESVLKMRNSLAACSLFLKRTKIDRESFCSQTVRKIIGFFIISWGWRWFFSPNYFYLVVLEKFIFEKEKFSLFFPHSDATRVKAWLNEDKMQANNELLKDILYQCHSHTVVFNTLCNPPTI